MGARHSPWQIGIGEAQAQKFIKRKFDANAYIDITAQMDTHGVSRGRGPLKEVHPCGCVDVWMCVCVCERALACLHVQWELDRFRAHA